MSHFIVTNELHDKLKQSLPSNEFTTVSGKPYLTRQEIVSIYKEYKPTESLLELVKLSKLSIPKKEDSTPKPKTKEYLELMERLRLEAKEKEFKDLILPKKEYQTLYDSKDEEAVSPAQMTKEFKNNLTTIVNILISVVSVAYAVWYWTESSWGLPISYRVLLSLFFAVLVLVAEVVVYLGYLNKVETARVTERNKKEVKKVIKTL